MNTTFTEYATYTKDLATSFWKNCMKKIHFLMYCPKIQPWRAVEFTYCPITGDLCLFYFWIKVYHLPYTHPNYGVFEAFLHVEEEYIPKIFFVSCPFEGRANHGRPIQPFCPNGLDWPAVVSLALKRTQYKTFFGYKFFF